MAQRRLLTDEERQAFFGIPLDPDGMARGSSGDTRSDRARIQVLVYRDDLGDTRMLFVASRRHVGR